MRWNDMGVMVSEPKVVQRNYMMIGRGDEGRNDQNEEMMQYAQ